MPEQEPVRLTSAPRRIDGSVVLDQAELVVFGVGHDDNNPLVVVVSLAGGSSPQGEDTRYGLVDVVHGDVEMSADLTNLRLRNRLEHQPRQQIIRLAEVYPALFRGAGLTTQQDAPKPGHTIRVDAVEGHTRPLVRHPASLQFRTSHLAAKFGAARTTITSVIAPRRWRYEPF
jgi:hypothetical protein